MKPDIFYTFLTIFLFLHPVGSQARDETVNKTNKVNYETGKLTNTRLRALLKYSSSENIEKLTKMVFFRHRLMIKIGFTFLAVLYPRNLQTNSMNVTTESVVTSETSKTNEQESGELENTGYPPSAFTMEQLRAGAVVFYFLGMLYMFVALAIVCDEFFVPSLEVIAEKLNLSADVAGATFMAAGGSAPELFTNVAGLFIISSPVGIGTVVGSAVFNILFVIGACSLASKELLCLTWWPLFRDGIFYSAGLAILIVTFRDGHVTLLESAILIGCYVSYAVFMKFNRQIEDKVKGCLHRKSDELTPRFSDIVISRRSIIVRHVRRTPSGRLIDEHGNYMGVAKGKTIMKSGGIYVVEEDPESLDDPPDHNENKGKERDQTKSGEQAGVQGKVISPTSPESRDIQLTNIAVKDTKSQQSLKKDVSKTFELSKNISILSVDSASTQTEEGSETRSINADEESYLSEEGIGNVHVNEDPAESSDVGDDDDDEEDNVPLDISWPSETWNQIKFIAVVPIIIPLWLTLADVRKPGSEKWVVLSFTGSIIWIGVYSYLMVWWAVVTGKVFDISDTIMGMTFLAAGTSVPDLLTSVIVARKGKGDMAVSSSVGSNLFDITIGLPVPWFIHIAIYQTNYKVDNRGMLCSIILLFLMLVMVVLSIAGCGWKMHKGLGMIMLVFYIMFLAVAIMLENNVFECPNIL